MIKGKTSNFEDLKVEHFNCYFSEIREVSHSQLHQKQGIKI